VIFDLDICYAGLVHLDTIWIMFDGQGHMSKFAVTW